MTRTWEDAAEAWLRALSLLLAALVVLGFTSGLRDTRAVSLVVPRVTAPLAPSVPEGKDARARIEVVTEAGAPAVDATVTMYSIAGEQAYLVAARRCDAGGRATFLGVPRGEVWVLAEAPGRQRSSTRAVLLAEPKSLRLTLRPASELVVRVVDEEGGAVAGATVEARGADPLPFLARTGGDGATTFGRLGPAPWIVRAYKPGLELATKRGVAEPAVTLVLRALGVLVVHVKTPAGEPAAGATVLVGGPQLRPARSIVADERGVARVPGLPRGAYQVSASSGAWASDAEIGVPLERGEVKEVELQLGEGRVVDVRVTDGDGADAPPIAGARVVLAEDLVTSFPREALTARDGTARLGPISRRPASLRVEADGFVPYGLLVPELDKGPLAIGLVRGGKLVVQVDDDRGMPVPGASIEIVGVDFAGMPVDETAGRARFRATHFAWALPGPQALLPAGELGVTLGPIPGIPAAGGVADAPRIPELDPSAEGAWITGRDGRFASPPVPPGRLRAIARHPGYVEAVSDVAHLASGGEATVKITLRAGATLSGRVVDASGRGVGGARVELSATRGSLVRSLLTADDGAFAFASVPSEIALTVARPDSVDRVAVARALELGDGEQRELVITLPEARPSAEVRVLDDRSFPLDGVQVTAVSLSDDSPLRVTRFTDKDGQAVLPDAVGLRARLTASLPGFATEIVTADLSTTALVLSLRRGVGATGEVRTRGGREPLDGVEIVAVGATGTRRARTDAAGRYELRDLSPGKLRVTLTKRGFGRAEQVLLVPTGGETKLELPRIVIEEAGSIEGEVVDARGDPVAGARVALDAAPAYLPIGPLPAGVAVTNARGQFVLSDVADGPVTLEAYSADHGRGRERAHARRGEIVRDVRIRLTEAVAGAETATAGGVAVTLGERRDDDGPVFVVRHVARGSEAERAGVEEDDVVLSVDGHAPASLEDLRARLSGPLGLDVTVIVSREGVEHRLRVARERVRR
ncbi:MAG: carboxypeptidase regulatory-like domain-containing protein [Polyangiaceae bacterium]|nr:carboxypeptidase regulatory-like domain-containing protein [Polyangiaceae bacterium]